MKKLQYSKMAAEGHVAITFGGILRWVHTNPYKKWGQSRRRVKSLRETDGWKEWQKEWVDGLVLLSREDGHDS